MNKNKVLFVLLGLIVFTSLSAILFYFSENRVPTYILEGYKLNDSNSKYLLKEEGTFYSLEVTNSQGKRGEFIVQPNPELSKFTNQQVKVEGKYILQDKKVQVVLEKVNAVDFESK